MNYHVSWRPPALAAFVAVLLAACAIPVRQIKLDRPLERATGKSFVLESDADFSVGTGYSRTLREGVRWELFGTIDAGDVYRSPDQTLTVEGYNVHEAYPVVKDSSLVGVYLPVEKTFTPTSKNVSLIINNTQGAQK